MWKSVLVAVSIGVLSLAAVASQQTPPTAAPPAAGSAQTSGPEMMKMHERMMAGMKAADTKLDELIKSMNAATGDAKVSAMAQAVTELANQHKTMHGHMGMMHEQMMPMMMGGRGMMMKK